MLMYNPRGVPTVVYICVCDIMLRADAQAVMRTTEGVMSDDDDDGDDG